MCIIESQESQEHNEHIYSDMPRLIPIVYHNDQDCTLSVDMFVNHEHSFHPKIVDYASTLYHIIDQKIVSACKLEYGVIEYVRNKNPVNIYYPTIQDWVNSYDSTKDVKYVLDNVFIGENYVSLWEVIDHV